MTNASLRACIVLRRFALAFRRASSASCSSRAASSCARAACARRFRGEGAAARRQLSHLSRPPDHSAQGLNIPFGVNSSLRSSPSGNQNIAIWSLAMKSGPPDRPIRSVSSSQYVSVDFQIILSSKMSKNHLFIEIWSKIDQILDYPQIMY